MGEPNLIIASLSYFLAVFVYLGIQFSGAPTWGKVLLTFALLFFVFLAAIKTIDWLIWRTAEWLYQIRNALSISERTRLLENIGRLKEYQTDILNQYVPVLEVIGGNPGPVYKLKTNTLDIPYAFIETFINQSTANNLCPVRRWAEGTKDHEYADAITDYMIMLGFAKKANGNQPAEWIDRQAALAWIGLD